MRFFLISYIFCLFCFFFFFFFFKQKTAYEIGLGIPAEPLFRSERDCRLNASNLFLSLILHLGNLFLIVQLHFSKLFLILKSGVNHRSEERRVGKECRNRWLLYQFKKNTYV